MHQRLVTLLCLGVLAVSCGGATTEPEQSSSVPGTPGPTTAEEPTEPLRGFSLSPRSSEPDDFTEFLELVGAGGTLLEWVGDADEWASEFGTPDVVVGVADSIGVEPITIGSWARTEDGTPLRPLTPEQVAAYVDGARSFAERHHPRYMGFGVEVDTIHREQPETWEEATSLFADVADAIHVASPDTRVIVVFQLERLRGRNGGLFGGIDDESRASWDLIDEFPGADVVGFTSYPGLVFEDPAAVPDDYYLSIVDHVDRPIAFTEIGWPAGGDLGPYSGTPEKQAAFVERFPELIDGLDVEFYTWSFLFDPPTPPPFDTTGLFTSAGDPRPAWQAWLAGD